MKEKIIVLALVSAGFTASAMAADTTVINITANIVASPCVVNTTQLNIDLKDIQASTLATAGATSGWSDPQKISLINCPATTSSVIATFTGDPATNGDTNGYANEGTGNDSSISVQLADDNATPNYLSNGKTSEVAVVNNAADFTVKARLYTSGSAKPGLVASHVNVGFEYK